MLVFIRAVSSSLLPQSSPDPSAHCCCSGVRARALAYVRVRYVCRDSANRAYTFYTSRTPRNSDTPFPCCRRETLSGSARQKPKLVEDERERERARASRGVRLSATNRDALTGFKPTRATFVIDTVAFESPAVGDGRRVQEARRDESTTASQRASVRGEVNEVEK